MRKIRYRSFLFLFFVLILIFSLPLHFIDQLRSKTVQMIYPAWQGLSLIVKEDREEIEQLKLENHHLRVQVETIREWLQFEERLDAQFKRVHDIALYEGKEERERDFLKRRSNYLCALLDKQYQSLPAQVIFREPATWNSSIWLNVGEQDNQALGRTIVAKNSPVLVGTAVVGMVEFVGPKQSRARLITDAKLSLAVRAIRGNESNRLLREHTDALILGLEVKQDVDRREEMLRLLYQLKGDLHLKTADRYLAKGELKGCGSPLWRSGHQLLKGVGFNYDFSDEEGPARALRGSEVILQVGDLLVTSGLDGIFPADLPIALVTKISPLREGSCSYDLEAKALCSHLDELRSVRVLPPKT